jgi:hypothetical protein
MRLSTTTRLPLLPLLPLLLLVMVMMAPTTVLSQPEYRVPAQVAPFIDHLAFDTEARNEARQLR